MVLGSLNGMIYLRCQNRFESLSNVAVKKLLDARRNANVQKLTSSALHCVCVEVNANDYDNFYLNC